MVREVIYTNCPVSFLRDSRRSHTTIHSSLLQWWSNQQGFWPVMQSTIWMKGRPRSSSLAGSLRPQNPQTRWILHSKSSNYGAWQASAQSWQSLLVGWIWITIKHGQGHEDSQGPSGCPPPPLQAMCSSAPLFLSAYFCSWSFGPRTPIWSVWLRATQIGQDQLVQLWSFC